MERWARNPYFDLFEADGKSVGIFSRLFGARGALELQNEVL